MGGGGGHKGKLGITHTCIDHGSNTIMLVAMVMTVRVGSTISHHVDTIAKEIRGTR